MTEFCLWTSSRVGALILETVNLRRWMFGKNLGLGCEIDPTCGNTMRQLPGWLSSAEDSQGTIWGTLRPCSTTLALCQRRITRTQPTPCETWCTRLGTTRRPAHQNKGRRRRHRAADRTPAWQVLAWQDGRPVFPDTLLSRSTEGTSEHDEILSVEEGVRSLAPP